MTEMSQLEKWVPELRSRFPALSRQLNGQEVAYLDGPAGTQVPQSVIDAIVHYLQHSNANRHGSFVTAEETEQMLVGLREQLRALQEG